MENGFSYLTGDQSLAKELMNEMLPKEFPNKSHLDEDSDPLMKITSQNLLMYYTDYYHKKYEE